METPIDLLPSSDGPLRLLHRIDLGCDTLCCAMSEEGEYFAVGCADGGIRVFMTESGALVYKLSAPQKTYGSVTCLKFRHFTPELSTLHVLLATYSVGYVVHWHVTSSQVIGTIKEDHGILRAAYSPDMRLFATVGYDPNVRVYSEATGKHIQTYEASPSPTVMDGHRRRVCAVTYHPSINNIMLSAGWDDTIQFWDLRSPHAFKDIFGVHVCGDSVDIEPRQSNILVGSWRDKDSLQIYDFDSTKLLKTFLPDKGRQSMLNCAQWIDQGMIACGGGSENMARILQRQNEKSQGRVTKLPNAVYCQDYKITKSGRRIFAFNSGSMLYIFQHMFKGLIETEE